jgi:hypothetical protein
LGGYQPRSDAERKAEVDALIGRMADGVASAIASPSAWKQALQRQATFSQYSWGNQMLIAMQCPNASQVAGYVAWQEHGRQVRKGEKSIRILAPIIVPRDRGTPDETKVLVGFRVASVFDVAQTDPIPGARPEPLQEPRTSDAAKAWAALEAFATKEQGCRVIREWTGEARGYYQPGTRTIAVRSDLQGGWATKTLAHEIAHRILHPEGYDAGDEPKPRDLAEMEAESTAFVFLSSLGLETRDLEWYSFGYVASWHPDPKAVIAAGERIAKAARAMLDWTARFAGAREAA